MVDRLEGPLPLPAVFALFASEMLLVWALVSVVIACRAERWGCSLVVLEPLLTRVNALSRSLLW